MGTFVEGGPMAETNPEEGYETSFISCDLCSYEVNVEEKLTHKSNRWRDDVMFTECNKGKDEQDGEVVVESNLKLLP